MVDLSTLDRCWCAAVNLFGEIEQHHGRAEAERIFRELGSPSDLRLRKLNYLRMRSVCTMLQTEHGGRLNNQQLARRLAEINKTLPRGQRFGPSGDCESEDTLRKYIDQAFKAKDAPMKRRGGSRHGSGKHKAKPAGLRTI